MLRGWAADTGIDSLGQLLDEAQQLIALLIQAAAWVEKGSHAAGMQPDDEGCLLHRDIRDAIYPRIPLKTIVTTIGKLTVQAGGDGRGGKESGSAKRQRQSAVAALRRRAKELESREAEGLQQDYNAAAQATAGFSY